MGYPATPVVAAGLSFRFAGIVTFHLIDNVVFWDGEASKAYD